MPSLADPPFSRGVALLCQHDEDGAVGLLVNQLSEYRFGDVLAQMKLECLDSDLADAPVLIGGPVQQERGFVLHREARLLGIELPHQCRVVGHHVARHPGRDGRRRRP
jgi:putative transcriptional regulator